MRQITRKKLWSLFLVFTMILISIGETFTISQAKTPEVRFRVKTKKIKVGKSYQLKLKKAKGIKIKKKTFSKKGKAVRVNKKGKVIAKKKGKATVYCRVKYQRKGSRKLYNKKIQCKITVVAASTPNGQQGNGTSSDQPEIKTTPGNGAAGPSGQNTPKPGATDPSGQSTPKPGATDPSGQNTPKPEATDPSGQGTPKPGATDPSGQGTPKPGATDSSGQSTPKPEATDPSGQGTPKPEATDSSGQNTPKPEATDPSGQNTPKPEATDPSGQNTPEPDVSASSKPISTAIPGTGTTEQSRDAFELVHNMGLGINLGNTMEAYRAGASTTAQLETYWGQPITTQAMITGMRKAGFRSLRIPVSWSSMMSNDGNYTINPKLLQRVEEIMQYAFNEDMYVIINIHWDGQWWGQFGDKDSSVREKAWARYEAFWTQICDYYQDYSDHLIFESANEELGERLNDEWNDISSSEKPGILTKDECYQTVNEINQKFVDIVRASGGNNAKRFLLIAGYDTDIDMTCDSRYVMPQDTIAGRMMVSVHYYSPPTYCISGDPNNSWGYMASWGTDDDIAAMKTQLALMKRSFVDQGIPVVIGEYGVTDAKADNGTYVRKEGRDLFFQTLCDYAVNNGMCPMLWNTDNVYDKSSCKLKNETEAAIYLQLEKEAAETEVYTPVEFAGEHRWSGTLQNKSYNQYVTKTDDQSTFNVAGNGGCFTISGIDWDLYQNPIIKMTSNGLSGTRYCKFATEYADEGNWPYIKTANIYEGNWSLNNTITITLPANKLSGKQNLYFSLNGADFEGNITIQITEK